MNPVPTGFQFASSRSMVFKAFNELPLSYLHAAARARGSTTLVPLDVPKTRHETRVNRALYL